MITFSTFRLPFAASLLLFSTSSLLHSQVLAFHDLETRDVSAASPALSADSPSSTASDLPDAPGFTSPAAEGYVTLNRRGGEPWEGERRYGPFSRVSIGTDVSPLGIGIKSATILSRFFDARMRMDFFNYKVSNSNVEGFEAGGSIHLMSIGSVLDYYPHNSVFRLSGGAMLHNGNSVSATGDAPAGESFTVNGEKFYSAKPNASTGATPVTGSGVVGLHAAHGAEYLVSGGFGRFVPRSERHWSFPAEIGILFMGSPTVKMTTSGWVCKNTEAASCSDIASTTAPVSIDFNNALKAQLTKWNRTLAPFDIYPIFSYSVVYSFDVR